MSPASNGGKKPYVVNLRDRAYLVDARVHNMWCGRVKLPAQPVLIHWAYADEGDE